MNTSTKTRIYYRRKRKRRIFYAMTFLIFISTVVIILISNYIKFLTTSLVDNTHDPNLIGKNITVTNLMNKEIPTDKTDEIISILEESNIDNSTANSLVEMSKEYPQIEDIINNINKYPEELIEIVSKNPETIDYTINYLDNYPPNNNGENINIDNEYVTGKIPLFLQWDKRWGYFNYGEKALAINGCGPTALAMAVVGITGNTSVNPKVVADFSYENGYLVNEQGTSWSLISEGATHFGLNAKELPLSESVIKNTLRNGRPIIASMRPGDFTSTGHFIILTDVTDTGKITVNDSNSIKRSNKEWDIDIFMEQIKNLWAIYK